MNRLLADLYVKMEELSVGEQQRKEVKIPKGLSKISVRVNLTSQLNNNLIVYLPADTSGRVHVLGGMNVRQESDYKIGRVKCSAFSVNNGAEHSMDVQIQFGEPLTKDTTVYIWNRWAPPY